MAIPIGSGDPRLLAALQQGGQVPLALTAGPQQAYNPGLFGQLANGTTDAAGRQYVANQPYGTLGPAPTNTLGPPVTEGGQGTGAGPSVYQRLRNLANPTNGEPVSGAPTETTGGVMGELGTGAGTLASDAGAVAPEVEAAAPGLLSRLWAAGPTGAKAALGEGLADDFTIGGGLKAAAGGAATGALAGLPLTIAGHIVDDQKSGARHVVGQGLEGAGTGAAVGGGLASLAAAALPEEAAAGPPGWILAGLTAAGLGGYKAYEALTGNDGSSDTHKAFSSGWKDIDQSAQAWGITDPHVISGEKRLYNQVLKNSKDPTDKATIAQALSGVEQDFQARAQQKMDEQSAVNGRLALQSWAASALAPYQQAATQQGDLASQVYAGIAAKAPDPYTAALANATGQTFKTNAANQNLADAASVQALPYNSDQQQALIAQLQQQLAASKASSSSSGL